MADDNDITKRIPNFIEPFRVTPGASVKLAKDFDPGFKAGIEKKKDGADLLEGGIELLEYQARPAAQDTHGVLVVLQALDAAGKDGTIRHVMSGACTHRVRVRLQCPVGRGPNRTSFAGIRSGSRRAERSASFQPVALRGARRAGAPGNFPEKLPSTRARITSGRADMTRSTTGSVSSERLPDREAFPNLSREEQRARFLRRIIFPTTTGSSPPTTRRSVSPGRLPEAFEKFSHTSTAWAPWYVIPADRAVCSHRRRGGDRAGADHTHPQYHTGDDARRDLQTAKRLWKQGALERLRIRSRQTGRTTTRQFLQRRPSRTVERWQPGSWQPSTTGPAAPAASCSRAGVPVATAHQQTMLYSQPGWVEPTWPRCGSAPSASTGAQNSGRVAGGRGGDRDHERGETVAGSKDREPRRTGDHLAGHANCRRRRRARRRRGIHWFRSRPACRSPPTRQP